MPQGVPLSHRPRGSRHLLVMNPDPSLLSGFVTHRAVMGPANFPGIPEADQRRMLETALTNAMCDTDGRSGPVDKSADIV